jgi:hypothetical protein
MNILPMERNTEFGFFGSSLSKVIKGSSYDASGSYTILGVILKRIFAMTSPSLYVSFKLIDIPKNKR